MPTKRRPPKVSKRVAGSVRLPTQLVRAKLGPAAFSVWRVLLWRRDSRGASFARLSTIARAAGVSVRCAQSALRKLRRVGLVTTRLFLRNGHARVSARLIVGNWQNGLVTVQRKNEKPLLALGRGGARKGAGRPARKSVNVLTSEFKGDRSFFKGDRPIIQRRSSSCQRFTESPSDAMSLQVSTGPLRKTYKRESSLSVVSNETTEENRRAERGAFTLSFEESRREGAGRFDLGWDAFAALGISCLCEDEPTLARLFARGGPFLPPYLTADLLAVPRVPSPPLLDSELSRLRRVEALVRCYRALIEARTGEPCYVLARGDVRRSRFFGSLADAASSLIDQEVAPASWAAFSWDVWHHYSNRPARTSPPLNWVYSTSRVNERLGWFRREESSYGGGHRVFSARHKELLSGADGYRRCLLVSLRREVRLGRRFNAGLIATVACDLLDEFFPAGFAEALASAREGGEKDGERIRLLVEEGAFLW